MRIPISVMTMIMGAALALTGAESSPAPASGTKVGESMSPAAVTILSSVKEDGFLKLVLQEFSRQHADLRVNLSVQPDREKILQKLDAGEIDLAVVQLAATGRQPVFQALKPFAVVVNPSNPLENISLRRLGKVFDGSIRAWSELGGPKMPLRLMVFPDHSPEGSLLLGLLNLKTMAGTNRITDSSGRAIAALVAYDAGALGCVPSEFVTADVKLLKVDGVLPDRKHVLSGEYPLTARIVVLQSAKASAASRQLVAYLRGPAGENACRYLSLIPIK